jgi:sugar phosphate isomerase/epimerase
MSLSITTDYVSDSGSALPYLKAIAQAGFSHIHWCHEWNTDKLYTASEIHEIGQWLKETGLSLLDLHASEGKESRWVSIDESRCEAGVALIENRMAMTAELGSDVIVLHIPLFDGANPDDWLAPASRSLDSLIPIHKRYNVSIALENVGSDQNWAQLKTLFGKYSAGFLGLCYDSGHGNFCPGSLDHLESLASRLKAIHIHDNDGSGDQHMIPFDGTVEWQRLAGIIGHSSYKKCVSLESGIKKYQEWDENRFLQHAFSAGMRLKKMIENVR